MSKANSLKVVFDTNALANDSFEVLAGSRMLELVERGRIVPVYGHVFMEETIAAYGSEKHREHLLTKRLPFIARTAKLLCLDFDAIWHAELVQGLGKKAPIYLHPRQHRWVQKSLLRVPNDGSWKVWHDAEAARVLDAARRDGQVSVWKQIRAEVAAWKERLSYDPKIHGGLDKREFLQRIFPHIGRALIFGMVRTKNPQAVFDRWARAWNDYPYFTHFVRDMAYLGYYAAHAEQAIDKNAQADMNLLSLLLNADMVVSNEKRFLRTAFQEVWAPRRKTLFTAEEFVRYMEKL